MMVLVVPVVLVVLVALDSFRRDASAAAALKPPPG